MKGNNANKPMKGNNANKQSKQTIRLDEAKLTEIVRESVARIMNEEIDWKHNPVSKVARRYGVGGPRYMGNDAESVDNKEGDVNPNHLIEYSKEHIVYSNKDGYVIRINSTTGSIYSSKEPGGRSYNKGTFGEYLSGKTTNDSLGTVRDLTPENIPDKMKTSKRTLATKIGVWFKLALPDYIKYDRDLCNGSNWMVFA